MIQNYSDPIVTLKQVYRAPEEGIQPVLGACIIGPHYIVRTYEDFKDTLKMGSYTGTAVTRNYTSLGRKSGQPAIGTNDVKVLVKEAQLAYAVYASNSCNFSFVDSTGRKQLSISDSGVAVQFIGSPYSSMDVAIGDTVKILVGSSTESKVVRGIEKGAGGKFTTLVLNSAVASGTLHKVSICKRQDCYVRSDDVSGSDSTVTVTANAKSEPIDLGEGSNSYEILAGTCYAEYRFLSNTFANKYGFVAGTKDDVEDMLGKVCLWNPLGLAVANAVEEANGNFVYFVSLDGDPTDSDSMVQQYQKAADLIADKDGIHGIVPCTDNKKVTLALLQYTEKQSAQEIPYFKYLYASKNIPSDSSLTTVNITDALIDWKVGENDNQPIANKRCSVVIADDAIYNSTMHVPNYCVAAALAGMRSGVEPHAPLSNVVLKAITCSERHGFTASQSKSLGANGFWRVGMREDGACISRRQLTSAATGDVNYDEQSIVCNIDSIGLTLKVTGRDLVGNTNISPVLLNILEAKLSYQLDLFKVSKDDLIGPQLLSGSIISIKQDPVYKDKIYAALEGEPPKPFNEFHITFYMR